jgi:hypothetical protein
MPDGIGKTIADGNTAEEDALWDFREICPWGRTKPGINKARKNKKVGGTAIIGDGVQIAVP